AHPARSAGSYSYAPPSAAGDDTGNRADRVVTEDSEAGHKEKSYDRLGNVVDETTTLVNPQPGTGDPFVHRMQYRYDSLGRLLDMTFPGLGQEVVAYGYDAGGLVTSAHGVYTR